MPEVYIVGVGPGSPEYLTPQARDFVKKADSVLGWELDLLPIRRLIRGKRIYFQDVTNYVEVTTRAAEEARQLNLNVAVPRIGDPCLSSGLTGLLKVFWDFKVTVVPGISSIQVVAALARVELANSLIVTFHDYGSAEERKRTLVQGLQSGRSLIVLSGDLKPHQLADWLLSQGADPSTEAAVGENLSLKDERVTCASLGEIRDGSFSWLSVTVVKSSGDSRG